MTDNVREILSGIEEGDFIGVFYRKHKTVLKLRTGYAENPSEHGLRIQPDYCYNIPGKSMKAGGSTGSAVGYIERSDIVKIEVIQKRDDVQRELERIAKDL